MKFASCHPERKRHAYGLCGPCSVKKWRTDNPSYRARNAEKAKKYYHANKEKVAASVRQRRYGITPEAWAATLVAQNHRCAICNEIAPLRPDHCHKTGQNRGALCDRCNGAIGMLRDEPLLADLAASYLRKWQNTR